MAEFAIPLDIMNRALDVVGARQLVTYTDDTPNVRVVTMYDKLRQYELRRNAWSFAIRRCVLRPLSTTSLQIIYPAYSADTSYNIGDIVASGGTLWVSKRAANEGTTPGTLPTAAGTLPWDRFFGPIWCDQWASQSTVGANGNPVSGYNAGEMAYVLSATAGDAPALYQSLVNDNAETPNAVDPWDAATIYGSGAVVSEGGTSYQSLVAYNLNNQPPNATYWTTTITSPTVSGSWRQVTGAAFTVPVITWPVNSGPVNDTYNRNVFPLPNGYLRRVNQNPSAGKQSIWGAPTNLIQADWEFDGGYLVSRSFGPLNFRFGADELDVSVFDPMFCEGLAGSIGYAACEPLNQAPEKKAAALQNYARAMGEARLANAIEQGAEMPPLDDWLGCRY